MSMPWRDTVMARTASIVFVVLAGVSLRLAAQDSVTIYRCTDAGGALLIQNDAPCPAGYTQETQVVDVPPPMPAEVPRAERMPEVVAAEEAELEALIAEVVPEPVPVTERIAPPALFRCTTWENTTFLTEDETPAERCAPIRVVGLDGRQRSGLGAACQTTHDTCEAVPEDELCASWRRRVDEAEFRWKFAGAGAEDPKRIEFERLAATYDNTTCVR